MRISTEWLNEFVATPPADKLGHIFEMAGIGVEEQEGDRFTLEITSNRGDWLSAIGLAREIGAMTEQPLRLPSVSVQSEGAAIEGRVQVEVENGDDCARYVARLIENVQVGESPEWMQQRLLAGGMRPVNNIVDITNYVMLEMGQPLHAFAADLITDNHIIVRRATHGEKITTLDGNEHELDANTLVIAGTDRILAVAGVMGGLDSEVSDNTKNILLESAHFAPGRVQYAARRLGFTTEASRRFERWVDPNGTLKAADRVAQLLQEIAGGTVAEGAIDRYVQPVSDTLVTIRPARCNAILGLHLTSDNIERLLKRLQFRILQRTDELIQVAVPTWRQDIQREIDLIEEVARMHGYEHVPTTLPRGVNPSAGRSLKLRLEEKAKSALLRCGLTEIMSVTLENQEEVERAGLQKTRDDAVTLLNPVTEDFTQLRTSLFPSLLRTLQRNARRPIRAFEIGKVYLPVAGQAQPQEKRHIGLALLDAPAAAHWQKQATTADFYYLKGVVSRLVSTLGAPEPQYAAAKIEPFHPGRCAVISMDGEDIGALGELHPEVAERYDLQHRAYLASIDLEALVRHISITVQYEPLPRMPAAERDLALVLKQEVAAASVQSVLRETAGELLEELRLFDVYTGPPVPEGYKSLALSLRFRAADRTLRDEEIEAIMQRLQETAATQLGAQLRS